MHNGTRRWGLLVQGDRLNGEYLAPGIDLRAPQDVIAHRHGFTKSVQGLREPRAHPLDKLRMLVLAQDPSVTISADDGGGATTLWPDRRLAYAIDARPPATGTTLAGLAV